MRSGAISNAATKARRNEGCTKKENLSCSFREAFAAGRLCKKLGLKINVAAKIAESSIGTAAAVHLACAVPHVDWVVSLTNTYLAEDIVKVPIALKDGVVTLPEGKGLGVEVDEAAVARFRVD